MGISIMQWRIAVGVQFYCKAPILRTQFVFDSFRFYQIFFRPVKSPAFSREMYSPSRMQKFLEISRILVF